MPSSLFAVPLVLLAVGAAPVVAIDHHGPVLLPGGVALEARLVSTTGKKVFEPAAFVRQAGTAEFMRLPMTLVADDLYRAPLPPALAAHECEYFLEAFDEDGNGPFRKGSPERPLRLAKPQPPATATSHQPAATEPATARVEASGPARPLRTAGIALLAGGGALLVAGGISGGLALKDYEAEKGATELSAYESAKSAAKAEAVAADVLLGTGAVAAIVGIILWANDPNPAPSATRPISVSASPIRGGVCAVLSGSF